MAYYGRDPTTMKKENKQWNSLLQKERKRIHIKKIRAGPATDVYRAPKPLGGQPGRAFKPGELEETMKDWQHFYNKKNLATDPLSLGKSAPEALKEKQAKLDTRSKKLRSTKFPVTHSLKTDPTLLANRKNIQSVDSDGNPDVITKFDNLPVDDNVKSFYTKQLTPEQAKKNYKFSVTRGKKEKYFGGKTKKRRRKKKRKTRRRKKKTKRKRKYRKKRTRRKRGGNKQLSDKQTFLKEVKKNEKKLKPMFTDFMDRFIISKKTITFNMVLKEIENMKDSEFEKNINNIINNKSRSKKGGTWLPSIPSTTGDDNVDTYNCTLLVILILFAISQIAFSYMWLRGDPGLRFGLRPAIDNMRDILGPILYAVNIFCRVWVLFHNHPPQLDHLSASVRRQNNARDIMQQINHVEPMIIRRRLLEEAPDSVGTFDWQAMESFLNEVRQILEEFEIRYYAPADSTTGTKRGI